MASPEDVRRLALLRPEVIESLPAERLETLVRLAWATLAPKALLKGSAGA